MPSESIRTIRRCDFCTEPNAGWVLPVEDFTINSAREDIPDHASGGDWQCCTGCAALIAGGDWDGLADRALSAIGSRGHIADPEREVFEEIHRRVREHVTGPVRLDES